jgi:hypothetical protein
MARRSKILHDVTTALPNTRSDRSAGILQLMVPTEEELVAKMFNVMASG